MTEHLRPAIATVVRLGVSAVWVAMMAAACSSPADLGHDAFGERPSEVEVGEARGRQQTGAPAAGDAGRVLRHPVSAPSVEYAGVWVDGLGRLDAIEGEFLDVDVWERSPAGKGSPSVGACAVRVDGLLVCWGEGHAPVWSEELPAGFFTRVAVAWTHGCAVRVDGTVVCWGADGGPEVAAPAGEFVDVEMGEWWSCALDATAVSVCWEKPQPHPVFGSPSFTVAAGRGCTADGAHLGACWWGRERVGAPFTESTVEVVLDYFDGHVGCALGGDGTVTCWGEAWQSLSGLGGGRYTRIDVTSPSGPYVCGLTEGGSLDCWATEWLEAHQLYDPEALDNSVESFLARFEDPVRRFAGREPDFELGGPGTRYRFDVAGPFVDFDFENDAICAVHSDRSVSCWGHVWDNTEAGEDFVYPPGPFARVATGIGFACGLRTDETVACWGPDLDSESNAPDGQFAQIAAHYHACALRVDGTLLCSRQELEHGAWDAHVPPGRYRDVRIRGVTTCAVTVDGVPLCWSPKRLPYQAAPPQGRFVTVTPGSFTMACGARDDSAVVCWNESTGEERYDTYYNDFSRLALRSNHCVARAQGTLLCWHAAARATASAPQGRFIAASAGRRFNACAIGETGRVVCWQLEPQLDTEPETSAGPTSVVPNAYEAPKHTFVHLSATDWHACGVRTDKQLECWGYPDQEFAEFGHAGR